MMTIMGCKLVFRKYGIEIWQKFNQFLVIDRFYGYGKFYPSLEEAKKDSELTCRLYGVKVKRDDNPLK
ncbi:MAG: hypothetical protein K5839_02010 [Treponemataceae bacterium]|nr:hypothetical protein [Treponemataceae bacterium]